MVLWLLIKIVGVCLLVSYLIFGKLGVTVPVKYIKNKRNAAKEKFMDYLNKNDLL